MSSRGMTQAQMEARRRELERKRGEQRRRQVKQQIMEAAADIERELLILASDGASSLGAEEVAAISAVLEVAKSAPADNNIDVVFEEIQHERAKLMQPDFTAEQRKDEKQREKWVAEASAIGLKLELEARLEDLTYQANMKPSNGSSVAKSVNKAMDGNYKHFLKKYQRFGKKRWKLTRPMKNRPLTRNYVVKFSALIKTMREFGSPLARQLWSKKTALWP